MRTVYKKDILALLKKNEGKEYTGPDLARELDTREDRVREYLTALNTIEPCIIRIQRGRISYYSYQSKEFREQNMQPGFRRMY